mgnify:CR=1 FL=1
MKKLFFFAGILAMTALASCGNKQNAPAEGETIEVAATCFCTSAIGICPVPVSSSA